MLEDLLNDGSGAIHTELRPLAAALAAAPKPDSVLSWFDQPGVVKANLKLLASGTVPITHAGLSTLMPWRSAAYLRDLLMKCGVLPQIDRYLIQFEQWLDGFLEAQHAPGRRQVLERFAAWEVLRQLRGSTGRRPLNHGMTESAR